LNTHAYLYVHILPTLVCYRITSVSKFNALGHPAKFIVDTSKAGSGALAVTVDGPSKAQLTCDEVKEGYQFTYTPTVPGDYLVIIKYAGDVHIPGSPFRAHVTGKS
jgi:filamin